MFLTLGYLGREVVPLWFLPYLSSLGCGYILYIAWKVLNSDVVVSRDCAPDAALNFRDGFLMQLLNPKGIVATLPIATIQFPSEGIVGIQIAFWSLLLSLLAFGAPTCYAAVGSVLGKWITRPQVFKLVNVAMAMLLVYVVITLGYTNVYQPLFL
jgi:threonine/homoserine/homoserine lactone efflux protein